MSTEPVSKRPPLEGDERAQMKWALDTESAYRVRYAQHDGKMDRLLGAPYAPDAHPDHKPPVVWSRLPAWQAEYERVGWERLWTDAYTQGWLEGAWKRPLWFRTVHVPPTPSGECFITFTDGRYEWYPIAVTFGYIIKCDCCGARTTEGWECKLTLTNGTHETRCNTCAQIMPAEWQAKR